MGNPTATGLGVHTSRLALLRVLAPVVLTAACVSCVGSIGFVGLIAPHMARLLLRGGQTALLAEVPCWVRCWFCWQITSDVWLSCRCSCRQA